MDESMETSLALSVLSDDDDSNVMSNGHSSGSMNSHSRNKLPIRKGKPVCQYYLKTGKCNYGNRCKFHHPERDFELIQLLNRRDCFDFVQSGHCLYGTQCKYNHPRKFTELKENQSSLAFDWLPSPFYESKLEDEVENVKWNAFTSSVQSTSPLKSSLNHEGNHGQMYKHFEGHESFDESLCSVFSQSLDFNHESHQNSIPQQNASVFELPTNSNAFQNANYNRAVSKYYDEFSLF